MDFASTASSSSSSSTSPAFSPSLSPSSPTPTPPASPTPATTPLPLRPSGMRLRLSPSLRSKLSTAFRRLDYGWNPRVGLTRLRGFRWTKRAMGKWSLLAIIAFLSLLVMQQPMLFKAFIILAYTFALLLPTTSQFFLPATPIFSWLLLFYSSQFIPKSYRPHIWVSVLPTLESILYGANISDILTRYTSPFLDVMAWIPYGVVHFAAPFLVAGALWVGSKPAAVKFWGSAFGYMNLIGVGIQILVPCAPPWYELRNGLVPANYDMSGSPGGLARIDALFHSSGYTNTFANAPVPFGAFPSLHAACATMEALFLSHFFPRGRVWYWGYVFWLYWSSMYLTHHYLIDLVAGGSLAVTCFYLYLPEDLRHLHPAPSLPSHHYLYNFKSGTNEAGTERFGEGWEDGRDVV